MDYYTSYEEPESELDLVEVLWDLLSQWKAILIVALVLAIAVPAAKLFKDMSSYRAETSKQEAIAASQSDKSAEELVEEALAGLSEEDKATVQRLAKQQELALSQEAYLNDSLLLSGDLANQQQLQMRFYLTTTSGATLQPLADAYKAFLSHDSVMEHIGAALDPKADVKYIRELVSLSTGTVPDSEATGLIATVSVVLTPDADVSAVREAVTEELEGFKDGLTQSIGEHEISLIDAEQTQTYNTSSMDRRVNLTNGINNLLNSYKTAVSSLTAEQKTALEEINKIASNAAVEAKDTDGEPAPLKTDAVEAPVFNIKFALIGFVGGIFAYAIVYMIAIALGKRFTCAEELESYTASRLLGDVYYSQPHKGLTKLFHSKLVDRRHYARKGDVSIQAQKAVSTIESVCEHAQVADVTMLTIDCMRGKSGRIVKDIVASVEASGITATVVNATAQLDEKALLSVKNAVFVVGNTAKTSDVWQLTELCHSYDVERLGCVYLKGY